jgi:hypothetical protein
LERGNERIHEGTANYFNSPTGDGSASPAEINISVENSAPPHVDTPVCKRWETSVGASPNIINAMMALTKRKRKVVDYSDKKQRPKKTIAALRLHASTGRPVRRKKVVKSARRVMTKQVKTGKSTLRDRPAGQNNHTSTKLKFNKRKPSQTAKATRDTFPGNAYDGDYTFYNDAGAVMRADMSTSEYNWSNIVAFEETKFSTVSVGSGDIYNKHPNACKMLRDLIVEVKHKKAGIFNSSKPSPWNEKINSIDLSRGTASVALHADEPVYRFLCDILNIFKGLCTLEPSSQLFNSNGETGIEIVCCDWDGDDQMRHFDNLNEDGKYISYFQSLVDSDANKRYSPSTGDGNCSIFLNPFAVEDHLGLLDGSYKLLPNFTCTLMAGNAGHYGLGNYSLMGGRYKVFGYCDSQGYNRRSIKSRMDVVHFNFVPNMLSIREVSGKTRTMANICLKGFTCRGGCVADTKNVSNTINFHFYPYCRCCLLNRFDIAMETLLDHNCDLPIASTIARYVGENELEAGFEFGMEVMGEVINKERYKFQYPRLADHIVGMIACVDQYLSHDNFEQLKDNNGNALYLCTLSLRSFLAGVKQSATKSECNVMLVFDVASSVGTLVAVKAIKPGDVLVVYNPAMTSHSDEVDIEADEAFVVLAQQKLVRYYCRNSV